LRAGLLKALQALLQPGHLLHQLVDLEATPTRSHKAFIRHNYADSYTRIDRAERSSGELERYNIRRDVSLCLLNGTGR
jgi:hypothetical protein